MKIEVETPTRGDGPVRCPYCHDAIISEGCTCPECSAVHHKVCLLEAPRCASCRTDMSSVLAGAIPSVGQQPERHSLLGGRIATGCFVLMVLLPVLGVATVLKSLEVVDEDDRRETPPAARLAEWTEALEDADPAVRLRAVHGLRRVGQAAIPALATALDDADTKVVQEALVALAGRGRDAKLALPELIRVLERSDPGLRASAAGVLGRLDPDAIVPAIPALARLTEDPDSAVRTRALLTLSGVASPRASAALAKALSSSDTNVRRMAESALITRKSTAIDAVPTLAAILSEKSSSVESRRAAVRVLGAIGGDASVPPLVTALRDPDPKVYATAVRTLELQGPRAAPAIDQLIPLLSDELPTARRNAARVLVTIGDLATPAILIALESPDVEVRRISVKTLARNRTASSGRIQALAQALGDHDVRVRNAASAALINVGSRAKVAVPNLISALGSDYPDSRKRAASILGKLGGSAIEPLLAVIADDPVRAPGAARALSLMTRTALTRQRERVAPALVKALQNDDTSLRHQASQALIRLGRSALSELPDLLPLLESHKEARAVMSRLGTSAVTEIQRALTHEDAAVRAGACTALRLLGSRGRAAAAALVQRLGDEAPAVRAAAAAALKRTGGATTNVLMATLERQPQSADYVLELLHRPPATDRSAATLIEVMKTNSPSAREKAAMLLTRIGKAAIPALRRALESDDTLLKTQALGILASVGRSQETVSQAIAACATDPDATVRAAALEALGEMRLGEELLKKGLEDPSPTVRSSAVLGLGRSSRAGESLVSKLARDPAPQVRAAVVESISRRHGPNTPHVLAALDDPAPAVRLAAARAFARSSGRQSSVPLLLALLEKDESEEIREALVKALSRHVDLPAARDAVLGALAKDASPKVRLAAATAVSRGWEQTDPVVEALSAAVSDESLLVRRSVVQTLARGGSAAIPALTKASRDMDPTVRREALGGLRQIKRSIRQRQR